MSEIYQVTIITQDEQQFTGKMSRREPAIVNGFVTLATEDGQWLYFTPSDVKRIVYVPDTKTEEQPNGDVQSDAPVEDQVVASDVSKDAEAVLPDDAA